MASTAELSPAEERRAAQEAEYGEFVAIEPIAIDGVRAFNPGDPVPKSHVDSGIVAEDQVARRTTKAGKAVTAPPETSQEG